MSTSPVFLLLSERSGSNLLRTLLSNHSALSGPVSPHFFYYFDELLYLFGDFRDKANIIKLMKDMIGLANLRLFNWNMNASSDKLYALYEPATFIDCVDLLYKEKAKMEGKPNYVCKENDLFFYAPYFMKKYSTAKYIYLYRDPRDYVASIIKHPEFRMTTYDAVLKWNKEQNQCSKLKNNYGFNALSISYENLVSKTEKTISNVLDFLGLPIEDACFSTDEKKNKELSWNLMWSNLRKPVLKSNFGKFSSELNDQQIAMIETLSIFNMNRLGYQPISNCKWVPDKRFKSRNKKEKKRVRKLSEISNDKRYVERNEYMKLLKRRLSGLDAHNN